MQYRNNMAGSTVMSVSMIPQATVLGAGAAAAHLDSSLCHPWRHTGLGEVAGVNGLGQKLGQVQVLLQGAPIWGFSWLAHLVSSPCKQQTLQTPHHDLGRELRISGSAQQRADQPPLISG